jgi:UDP-4-amino-4,6-dideoxy-N-acetyl-beta-L-altrosamine N-acetyltransferase
MLKIELKDIKFEDVEIIRNWRNSPEISKYMYTDDYISIEKQEKWFKNLVIDKAQKQWLIVYENEKIGVAYLYNIRENFRSCYWGFYLAERNHRGKGIGSLVENEVIEYVFNVLDYNKLLCEVLEQNNRVIKMHEKFGFRREGYFREHILKNGEYLDVVSLALLKSEWKVNKK